MGRDFWVPQTKRELVSWLSNRYPKDRGRFQGMKKDRLYAIYYTLRRAGGL